ncbi:MAG: tetratricopeptide repeat protein [Bacteroidaceae bacterium]|nr:tetratricopeptide repeat protein [Bacteroidaceae bacterium]
MLRPRIIAAAIAIAAAAITCQAQETAETPAAASTTYQQLVRRGFDLMAADSLAEAEHTLRQALKAEPAAPGNVLIWAHLAQIAERMGRDAEALDAYNIAIGMSPQGWGLRLNRASLHIKMGDDDRALNDYNEILYAEPDHQETLLMRAFLHRTRRRLKEARIDYEHLLSLNPTHEEGLQGLALLNNADRRPQEAMQNINSVIALYPTHAAGYALRGGFELERSQYEKAEQDFSRAIALEPENPTLRLARARLYQQTKRRTLAREDVRAAARLGASREDIAAVAGVKR